MVKVGLREANLHFSKYIKMLKDGKEVILTDRGTPFAIMKPIRRETSREERIRQLEKQGILKAAIREKFPLHKLVILKGKSLSELVMEDREDGF